MSEEGKEIQLHPKSRKEIIILVRISPSFLVTYRQEGGRRSEHSPYGQQSTRSSFRSFLCL